MTAKQTNTDMKFPGDQDGWLVPVPGIISSIALAFTGTSAALDDNLADTMGTAQNFIICRLTSTQDCFIKVRSTPTAQTDGTSHFLPAGIPQDFSFYSGYKLAAISNGVDGTLYITALG